MKLLKKRKWNRKFRKVKKATPFIALAAFGEAAIYLAGREEGKKKGAKMNIPE